MGEKTKKDKKLFDFIFDNIILSIEFLILVGIWVIIVISIPLTKIFSFFTETGPIGDTIGGTTAPFIGLLSAYLVYRAFQAQIRANQLAQDQFAIQSFNEVLGKLIENYKKNVEKEEILVVVPSDYISKMFYSNLPPELKPFSGIKKINNLAAFFTEDILKTDESIVESKEIDTSKETQDKTSHWKILNLNLRFEGKGRGNNFFSILEYTSYSFLIIEFVFSKIQNTNETTTKEYYKEIFFWLFWKQLSI